MRIKPGIYSEEDRTRCKICGETHEHLGSHIYHAHGIKANEYKERFGLAHGLSLISKTVEKKKQLRYAENRDKYIANITTGKALDNRFKVGDRQPMKYIARRTREQNIKNIQQHNKKREMELCPVCNKGYMGLDSHLFNKHMLLRVKQNGKEIL